MILSIDFRTDIPAFYSDWILNRFKEGYLMFRNPAAPTTVHKVILDKEHIEGIIWCSKDYRPIIPRLHEITDKFPSIFHYTVTSYGGDIESGLKCGADNGVEQLSEIYGKERVIWRYDPIFLTDLYTKMWHITSFKFLAYRFSNSVDRVVINFISLYDKVKRHMPQLKLMSNEDKIELIQEFLKYCNEYGLKLQTCGNGLQFKDLKGVEVTGCLDEHALNLMSIYPKQNKKASQWGCLCYPNTSIGEYNTCLHKCKYCYASSDFDKCDLNYKLHDPNSPLLIGHLNPNDHVIEMKPKLLNTGQLKLEF